MALANPFKEGSRKRSLKTLKSTSSQMKRKKNQSIDQMTSSSSISASSTRNPPLGRLLHPRRVSIPRRVDCQQPADGVSRAPGRRDLLVQLHGDRARVVAV